MRVPNSDKDKIGLLQIFEIVSGTFQLSSLLGDEREATKENVERKQARGIGENTEEEEDINDVSDDDDDDSIPYNPKNLPLGWDGKPIPYWLYKLHGLNISFPCEICGNQVYKGPKAFQRHFNEWRHSHGMRCLGIPNTAHFANITKISDAVELWGKIRRQKESLKWNPEHDEEFEDSAGNVAPLIRPVRLLSKYNEPNLFMVLVWRLKMIANSMECPEHF
ncbi:Splicing factor 3A subunit 3 [Dirofilaria immitis]|nr:Splicing factor 3A subunit 3 [Dirofilaria immitis]